jgi:DNA-binding PadR family transcriptional regulator
MNNINDLDISLLGFISEQPMHGYELHKRVTDWSGFGIVWNIKIGKLYAMLNRLEKASYIRSTLTKDGNRPTRNEFSITASGKEKFEAWLVHPVSHGREFRIIFLLKLYFSLRNGIIKANNLIASQIDTCKSWLSEGKILNNFDFVQNDENNFLNIVNKYRQIQIQGYLVWLEWCKELLKERLL